MAKVQKSLLINEDLVGLLDLLQTRTGASFTRQVTAAVLQYLFQRPEGPNPCWMEFAVGLDDGKLSIDDILQDRESDADAESQFVSDLEIDGDSAAPPDDATAGLRDVRDHFQMLADSALKGWGAMREPATVNVALRIAQYWKYGRNVFAKSKDRARASDADSGEK